MGCGKNEENDGGEIAEKIASGRFEAESK